ncbi:hypothetical protein JNJ66_01005 [Candidatus Saccharibacteria bacterium]|nr:hypothetical protein [Candidatus Saccharibacteria bacterium]
MASGIDLKAIARSRVVIAKKLIDMKDWEMAVYVMAMALELALKAAACKALRFETYPEANHDDDKYFKSHKFDRLLKISGMTDVFSVRKPMINANAFQNWSIFTAPLIFGNKDYTAMRYDPRMQANFQEANAKALYDALYADDDSILKTMTRLKRW